MGRKPSKAGIWTRVKSLFKSEETTPETTGYVYHSNPLEMQVPWLRSRGRKNVEEDLDNMDEIDGIVGASLDKIADFATCFEEENLFGFKIKLAEAQDKKVSPLEKEAVEFLNQTATDTGLQGIPCWDLIRDMVKKGNVFCENVLDENYKLAQVVQFPQSWQIEKHVDKSGNLKSGDPTEVLSDPRKARECAYTQINELGKPIAAFWPYQITHFKFGAGGGKTYVEPMLGRAIADWKRLKAQEDSLAIARIIRAWDTNVHKIPVGIGASEKEINDKINAYKMNMENDVITTYDTNSAGFVSTPRNSPMDVAKDFYVASYYSQDGKVVSGEIDKLSPSTAALDNINDIYWGVTRLLVSLNMPADFTGLKVGQRAFIDKGSEKTLEAFSRFIKRLQYCHAYGIKTILDMQLLLSGYDPRTLDYNIVYPSIVPQSAEMAARIILNKAQAANFWTGMGIPPELVGKHLLSFEPEAIEEWKAALTAQAAQNVKQQTVNPNQPKPVNPSKTAQPKQNTGEK